MKPQGVGIERIPLKDLLTFGIKHGYILPDEPLIGGKLPDWAIREFVTIEDFLDYGECPKGDVSSGISSSGYDVRAAGRFKIFTSANCETVSPKNVPEDAFIHKDLTGHVWKKTFLNKSDDRHCIHCNADYRTRLGRFKCEYANKHKWVQKVTEDNSPGKWICRKCSKETHDSGHCDPTHQLATEHCGPYIPNSIMIPPNSFALAETMELLHIPRNVNTLCLGKSTYARCGIITNFTPFEPGWRGVVTVEITNSTPLPVEIFAWQGIGQAQFELLFGSPQKSYGEKSNAKYQDQKGLQLPFC